MCLCFVQGTVLPHCFAVMCDIRYDFVSVCVCVCACVYLCSYAHEHRLIRFCVKLCVLGSVVPGMCMVCVYVCLCVPF